MIVYIIGDTYDKLLGLMNPLSNNSFNWTFNSTNSLGAIP